jgi:hypothetical protein
MSLTKSPALKRWGFLISIALFLNLLTFIPAKAAYQTSGLIADWVGSTLTNNTSQWNDGINSNKLDQSGTTYSSQNGGYVTLNGTSSSFLRSPNDLTTFSTDNMSMFFWIKPTSTDAILLQLGRNNPNDADTEMFFYLSAGKLAFWDFQSSVGFNGVTSTGTLVSGAWSYVGFTKSTSGSTATVTFYINGDASGSYTGSNKTISLNDFVIGKDYRDNSRYFNGSIARATVWNSTLSSLDALNNYNATNGIVIAPSISTSNNNQAVNAGVAITTAITTNTGGAVSSYSISPTLPTGLNMDSSGNIAGTPSSVQSSTSYTITATNPAGTSTSNFTLAVLINSTTAAFTNLSLAYYRQPTTLTVTVTGTTGKVTFKHQGKNIPGCIKVSTVSSSTITATCNWKPSVKKYVSLTAVFVPTSSAYATSNAAAIRPLVIARTNPR